MSARQLRRARERRGGPELTPRRRTAGRLPFATGAALGAAVVLAPAADAATFTVSNLDDDGAGSLRDAVDQASLNGVGTDDTIVFLSGLSGTLSLETGEIPIYSGGLDIQGPGASQITIDADGSSRIFRLYGFNPDEQVSISGLALADGSSAGDGGAVFSDDAGGDAAELTIANSVITGNYAQDNGGGIYLNGGSLTITGSLISGNESGSHGGGIKIGDTDGDEPYEAVVRDSIITGNSAGEDGGGVYTSGVDGGMLVERTTITDNLAYDGAGAMQIDSPGDGTAQPPVTIGETTIANNSSADYGGINMQFPNGPFTIQNSTISGNSSDEGAGGLTVLSSPGDGTASVLNSTIVGNAGAVGGGIYNPDVNEIRVSSSIVAGNTATDEGPDLGDDGSSGGFTVGFSLIGSTAATVAEDPAGSNIFGVDPLLGPLASNGGPTQTHLPALASPAIDKGVANGLASEQRGLARTGDLSLVANATAPTSARSRSRPPTARARGP